MPAQDVAVHRLEPGVACGRDAIGGDLDRLLVPAGELEDGRQVGADAEQLIEIVELLRPPRASERTCSAVSGSARQPSDTPSVVVAWSSQRRGRRVARARDPDRVPGQPLAPRQNMPSIIRSLGQCRRRPGRARRDGVGGTSSTARRRAASAPSESPAPRRKCAEPVVDEAEPRPVPTRLVAGRPRRRGRPRPARSGRQRRRLRRHAP